jgi:hypothetical protein
MGTETQADTVNGAKSLDARPASPPESKPMDSLGGELLTNPPARTAPTALEQQQSAYNLQHGQFEKDLKGYWDGVSAAKKNQHFVMEFPPIYNGPAKPKVPGHAPDVTPNSVPTIRQMLDDSKHLNQFAGGDKNQPEFELRQVGEKEFKQRYADEALRMGRQYGLDKDGVRDVVRSIYAFEDGGWGSHETLSSMPQSLVRDDKPAGETSQTDRLDYHVDGAGASSALGYNQLLTATTMQKIEFQSQPIADRLNQLALKDPARADKLHQKAAMVTALSGGIERELKSMADAEKSKKPEDQKDYLDKDGKYTDLLYRDFLKSKEPTAAGMSRQDMARAIQALNLDGDVGPIIQAQELGNLFKSADTLGYKSLLQGKEQSDAKAVAAFDALPAVQKEQAVHDILDRMQPPAPTGTAATGAAEANKSADFEAAKQALQEKLLAMRPGIDDNLAADKLTKSESDMLRTGILTLKDFGDPRGVLPEPAQLLLNKVAQSYYGGLTEAKLMPAGLELANLAGAQKAQQMIDSKNKDVPTPNFFSQAGYSANAVTNGRTASELLLQIERIMRGPSFSEEERPAQADFDHAFDIIAQHSN